MDARASLRIFWISGLTGVLVDVDHGVALILWRWVNPSISEGRLWHTPLFVASSIIAGYLVSHIGGLYSKLVLTLLLVITALVICFSPWVVWSYTK